jgi:hypothetical protein
MSAAWRLAPPSSVKGAVAEKQLENARELDPTFSLLSMAADEVRAGAMASA